MASKRTFQGVGGFSSRISSGFFSFSFVFPAVISWEIAWCECVRRGACRGALFIVYFPPGEAAEWNLHKKNFPRASACVCVGDFLSSWSSYSSYFFTLHPPRLRNDVFRMFVDALHNIVWRRLCRLRPTNSRAGGVSEWRMRWWHEDISSDGEIWLSFGNAAESSVLVSSLGDVAQCVIDYGKFFPATPTFARRAGFIDVSRTSRAGWSVARIHFFSLPWRVMKVNSHKRRAMLVRIAEINIDWDNLLAESFGLGFFWERRKSHSAHPWRFTLESIWNCFELLVSFSNWELKLFRIIVIGCS